MTRKALSIFLVVLTMLGLTYTFLVRVASVQKLGNPGLKLCATPLLYPNQELARTNSVFLPDKVLNYQSKLLPLTKAEVEWLPQDTTYGRRRYWSADNFYVDVHAVLMGQDRTSIHKPQYCLTGQGFKIRKTEVTNIPIEKPHPYELKVMKMTVSKSMTRSDGSSQEVGGVYVYWFASDKQLTPFHLERMWLMARDLVITGVLKRWSYVSLLSTCEPGKETEIYSRMKELIPDLIPEFQLTPP
jgi:hypothetical protein